MTGSPWPQSLCQRSQTGGGVYPRRRCAQTCPSELAGTRWRRCTPWRLHAGSASSGLSVPESSIAANRQAVLHEVSFVGSADGAQVPCLGLWHGCKDGAASEGLRPGRRALLPAACIKLGSTVCETALHALPLQCQHAVIVAPDGCTGHWAWCHLSLPTAAWPAPHPRTALGPGPRLPFRYARPSPAMACQSDMPTKLINETADWLCMAAAIGQSDIVRHACSCTVCHHRPHSAKTLVCQSSEPRCLTRSTT